MRILVADDNPVLRSELSELLREDGHEVVTAEDGRQALAFLEREAFDVALLDLVMPGATGLEILRRLQASGSPTAVVMITGHGSVDVAVDAMKAGALDFLEKPFEIEALQRILQAIEDERRARRLLAQQAPDVAARQALVEDAARRKALLAVLGPDAKPPAGASRVLRIEEEGAPPDVFTPVQLYRLNEAIEGHIDRTERPVVYASGLRILEQVHGRDDLKAWVRHIGRRCGAKGGALVITGLDRSLASEIEAEMGLGQADPGLQAMLESLANPIRRAIVAYVASAGPASYSSILRMHFVDSSSKLSFHLQKLLADGLLAKAEGGAYVLTEAGRRAWRVVRALSDERHRPIVWLEGP